MRTTRWFWFTGVVAMMAACSGPAEESTGAELAPLTSGPVSATLSLPSVWSTGYCANVTVTDVGTAALTGWRVSVDLHQSTVTQLWSGSFTQSGTVITVTPASFNAAVAAKGTTSFGFCANDTGSNHQPTVTAVSATTAGCSPGASICSGNSVETCAANGTFGAPVACANKTCVAGVCSGTCAPGAISCIGNSAALCNATGTPVVTTNCTALSQTCVPGAGCAGVCAAGSITCNGNTSETCSAAGALVAANCTPLNRTCVAGMGCI